MDETCGPRPPSSPDCSRPPPDLEPVAAIRDLPQSSQHNPDAYAGFSDLYEPGRKPGPITEAVCWAHGRRKLFKLAEVARAPLAAEAVPQIDAIFDAERAINRLPAEQRLAVRHEHIAPLVADLGVWMREQRGRLSRHADLAKAMDYMLKRGTRSPGS